MNEDTLFSSLVEGLGQVQLCPVDASVSSPPGALSSPGAPGHAAPTSAHSPRRAGERSGPPVLSSPCPQKALVGGAPLPQGERHRMAAPRQATPPWGFPAPSSSPVAAGSRNGRRQVSLPPPQCPGVRRRLGESLVLTVAAKEGQVPTERHLLTSWRLRRPVRSAGAAGGSVACCGGDVRHLEEPRGNVSGRVVSTSASYRMVIIRASCHPGDGGQYFYPIL